MSKMLKYDTNSFTPELNENFNSSISLIFEHLHVLVFFVRSHSVGAHVAHWLSGCAPSVCAGRQRVRIGCISFLCVVICACTTPDFRAEALRKNNSVGKHPEQEGGMRTSWVENDNFKTQLLTNSKCPKKKVQQERTLDFHVPQFKIKIEVTRHETVCLEFGCTILRHFEN